MIHCSLSLKPNVLSNTSTVASADVDDSDVNGLGFITVTTLFRPEPSIARISK